MDGFILHGDSRADQTLVSNVFLDEYMPAANGEYVKIYLYLLRCLSSDQAELSLTLIADRFDHTEGDILRALKYWEKMKLVKLEYSDADSLSGIRLLNSGEAAGKAAVPEPASPKADAPASASQKIPPFSMEEQQQLLFICEQYLGKTLSSTEVARICYFHDVLGFSADLIEYLVEYCVCKGSRSIHYIGTVALAWAEAGITTVSQARERTTTYTRGCFAIMKAFGIGDRNPVEPELKYIETWLHTYDFTLELVLEACRRTMERLHRPSFEYADRILKKWTEQKVHTLADVTALDQAHKGRSGQKKADRPVKPTGFSNFEQRDYDFDELEKQLLQSQ